MSAALDDNAWVKPMPGVFTFNQRFHYAWGDYRSAIFTSPDYAKNNLACIKCTGPGVWPVYVRGEHRGDADSWDEAKSLAALFIGMEET